MMSKHNNIPASKFTSVLVSLNTLANFSTWYFKKGMLYGESDSWWEGTGDRTHPHEGVDLCFYKTKQGRIANLDFGTYISPLYPGEVVKVFDDFIGQTILVRHTVFCKNDKQLYSMYGHVNPLFHIIPGIEVDCSEKIATIADSRVKKRPMLSHLHISTLWLPCSFPAETVKWGMKNNTTEIFCDPMKFIE